MTNIKTASDLKYYVEKSGKESNFFDAKSMRFFGDRMSNYGVRKVTIKVNYNEEGHYVESGIVVDAWELYRRKAVKHGLKSSAYFDMVTFGRVYPARDNSQPEN